MRFLRRRRSFNGSGFDGAAAMRDDGSPRRGSSYPFWMGMLFIWATLLGAISASDDDQDFMMDDVDELASEGSVCSAATTQSANSDEPASDPVLEQTQTKDPYAYDESEIVDDRPSIIFHNKAGKKSYIVKYYEPSFCKCTESAVNDTCNGLYMDVRWSELCLNLQLDPNSPVHNVATGDSIELHYPSQEDDACCQYDDIEDYDDNPDVFEWWRHCEAVFRIPLHKELVPFPREYYLSGAPLQGYAVCEDVEEDGLETNQEEIVEMDDADACKKVNAGDDGINEGEKEVASDVETYDECDEDTYESKLHADIDTFLRFKIYPIEMRGKSKENKLKQKAWGQNARRRYQMRKMADTDFERYKTL